MKGKKPTDLDKTSDFEENGDAVSRGESVKKPLTKNAKKNSRADEVHVDDNKPRIKIKINSGKGGDKVDETTTSKKTSKRKIDSENIGDKVDKTTQAKKAPKRKFDSDIIEEDGNGKGAQVEISFIPKKKRSKTDEKAIPKKKTSEKDETQRKSSRASLNASEKATAPAMADSDSLYLNIVPWKTEREALDGSFEAARALFTLYGPWKLPEVIPDDKFADVAKATLIKMDRHDRHEVFASAVTDDEAPEYSDKVKKPMDFGTMKKKVANGLYGKGSRAASAFYEDFLLVFDNCRLYNGDDCEVTTEAARILALLSEAYVSSCITVAKRFQ
jgi:hypothetical protein